MDFSKTFYNSKKFKSKIQLEFSKTKLNNLKNADDILIKNHIYKPNYKSLSLINSKKTLSQNGITNKIIKKVNSLYINKSTKNKDKTNNFIDFYTQTLKLKLRKHNEYKSLLDRIDLSTPSDSIFLSTKSNKQNQKRLMNVKLQSNKNKLFNMLIEKYKNTDNEQTGNNKKTEISFYNEFNNNQKINNNNKLFNDDISKTHFSTMYFSSTGINKSIEKSISSIKRNKNNYATPGKKIINKDNYINDNNNQILGDPKSENKISINTYSNNCNKTYNNNRINTINTYTYTNANCKTENNEINFTKNMQSFITSLNYIQPPPFPMEVRKQNLLDFHSHTRDFIYKKYFLFLQRNKLRKEKETNQLNSELRNMDLLKLIHFYKLFKPYTKYLDLYVLFLKETIKNKNKENQRLMIIKNNLFSEVLVSRKRLLKIHKRLKGYLNDKFLLLCVKNSTSNLELFEEKDKNEFERDLKTFEILKNYINDLSEINIKDLGNTIKKTLISSKQKKLTNYSNNLRHSYRKKSTLSNISNSSFTSTEKDIVSILKNSRMLYRAKPVFENIDEFDDYFQKSRKKIGILLKEANNLEIETANLRDHYFQQLKDIDIANYYYTKNEDEFNRLKKELLKIKNENLRLKLYKNSLLKTNKIKYKSGITKKLKELINIIIQQNNRTVNKIINKANMDKPNLALKEIEKIIIFLLDFKQKQKIINRNEYNEVVKDVEKKKRLMIIKKKKEEDKNKLEKKSKELIEKDAKILNISNIKTNIRIIPPNFNKKVIKETNSDDDKDSVDITY